MKVKLGAERGMGLFAFRVGLNSIGMLNMPSLCSDMV